VFEIDVADFRAEWELEGDQDNVAVCELCEREMALTFHHLIPKQEAARYKGKMSKVLGLGFRIWFSKMSKVLGLGCRV
jgi:hypothetical protein